MIIFRKLLKIKRKLTEVININKGYFFNISGHMVVAMGGSRSGTINPAKLSIF